MNFTRTLLAITISSVLFACGGSDDGGSTPADPSVQSVSVTGKVIDGYIQGAIVYLDLNMNSQLDEGEPTATSDDTGSYSIEVLESLLAQAKLAPIRAYLGEGAVDLDTGEEFKDSPVILSSPPVMDLAVGTSPPPMAVTPFTTDLTNRIEETLEEAQAGKADVTQLSVVVDAAKQELASEYGIEDTDVLMGDFLDDANVPTEVVTKLKDVAVKRVDEMQNDYQRQKEADEEAKDGETVKTGSSRESFVEWHTGELLHLLTEWKEVITEHEDGSKTIVESGTRYFCDSDYVVKVDGSNNPIAYEVYEVTKYYDGDGGFNSLAKFNIDKNGDGDARFYGQSYRIGSVSEDKLTKRFVEYFDEGNPSDDDSSYPSFGRTYDGIDLVAAVKNGDMSAVDMVQKKETSQEFSDNGDIVELYQFMEYDSATFESIETSVPNYAERRTTTMNSTSTTHLVEKDWDADGSINEVNKQVSYSSGKTVDTNAYPVWAWRGDDVWEEYADYRYGWNDERTNYWYEQEVTTEMVEGVKVETTVGKRYVLDETTNTAGTDKVLFHEYVATYEYVSDELTIESTEWKHHALDNYSFTVDQDDIGQKVTYWQLDAPKFGLWVGHEFAEWGTIDVADLADKIASVLESGVAIEDIDDIHIAGLSSYNGELFTESFIYDEDDKARTWYNVYSENALDDNPTWEMETMTLTVEDTGLVFLAAPGALFALTPDNGDMICFGDYCTDTVTMPLAEFDAATGSFKTYFGWRENEPNYFFQTEAEAKAKFDELTK
ncbi:hypothetical protein J4N45_14185 [Vibrio sp. SCSIO 43140]|uniref:hypothetical protein n=1 Tax=Vibrio sp. SCSIO 43140 TaxID=2819100 RepID=UPI002075BC81|nr:hypothetical protein [Vibrio sp. SCSIO 43140]USD59655.1 hypothetical protein J4N45_14185 [Vibrio sp. SCSIO 43140]